LIKTPLEAARMTQTPYSTKCEAGARPELATFVASHHGRRGYLVEIMRLRQHSEDSSIKRDVVRPRKPRQSPPDGLKTAAQAAAKLNCSIKTLNGHVASGALRYVVIGHGTKRLRKMFTDPDLNEFIVNQTRKDVPCPSTRTETVARHSGTTISGCEVVGFTALQKRRTNAKPKK